MDNFDSNVEDWMMTEADVRRLRNHLMPVLEKHKLAGGVRFGLALRETWGAYLVSAHKRLDPAAGARFHAARRPCVACGCL